MINSISIALTGLDSATRRLNTSASNIANLQNGDVDLTREIVNLKLSEIEYKANLVTLQTAQDTTKELLRLFDRKV